MVAFQTKDQADIARCLRSLGTEDYSYRAIPFGFNYRMSNVHAELISISLEHFKYNLLGRKSIEGLYDQYIPTDWKRSTREIPWVYDFMLPDGIDVLKLMQTLHKNNVPVRVGFRPNHSQPEWYCTNTFPVTEQLASRLMYLPIDPLSLTTKMIRKWTRELIIEVEEQLG